MQQCQLLRQAISQMESPACGYCAKNSAYVNKVGRNMIKANARCLLLFRPLPNFGIQNFSMWGMYDLSKAYGSMQNPLLIAESRTGKPAMVTLKIQPDCSTVHDTFLWANIYVRSHLGCGIDSIPSVFCRSHKYFKDAKVMQINRILKIS